MKPVAKRATPAAIAVLRQATALAPKRNKASDGLLPSKAHIKASPDSDHNTAVSHKITIDTGLIVTPFCKRNVRCIRM